MSPPPKPTPASVDRQREHQANERTFLAWLRTSIALIGFGFAIARFGIFLEQLRLSLGNAPALVEPALVEPRISSEAIGVSFAVLGVALILLAVWQYERAYRQIERGDYRPDRRFIATVAAIVALLGIASVPLMLLRNGTPPRDRAPSELAPSGCRWRSPPRSRRAVRVRGHLAWGSRARGDRPRRTSGYAPQRDRRAIAKRLQRKIARQRGIRV